MAYIERRGKGWRITVKRQENGKEVKHRKLITGDLKPKEVEKIAREFEVEVDQGKQTSAMMGATVASFAQEWFTHHVKAELASSTQAEYKKKLNEFILPALGNIKIRDLRPQDIIKFMDKLSDDQMKPRTLKYCFQVLRSMLSTAVYWQVIPSNPCASVRPPKYKAPEAGFYDPEEAGRFLAALETIPRQWMHYRLAGTLSIFTTLRRSEVLGLRWQDIDFEKRTLTVTQTMYWSKTEGFVFSVPKTDKSARTVNLGEYVVSLLEEYLDYKDSLSGRVVEVGNKYNRDRLVLTDLFGNPIKPYLVTSWFARFIKQHNLPHLSFHGLRHTAVSNMIAGGFDLITAGEIAGHSQKSTTANIYAHAIANNKKAASNALEVNLLKRKKG